MDLPRITRSELQCRDSSLKGTRDIREGTELSGFRMRTGEADFSHMEMLAEVIALFLGPSPTKPGRWVAYLSLHQSG